MPDATDWPDQIYDLLKQHGVRQVALVPDAGHARLITRCLALMPGGGLLWLAANGRDIAPLSQLARDAFARAKRGGQVLSLGGLPPDYPTLPAQPDDRYLQVALFSVI